MSSAPLRPAGHEIARRDDCLADAAVDRRRDARELEVELGRVDSGAGRGDIRLRFARCVDARVVLFARHRLDVDQLLAARCIGRSKLSAGNCARQLRFGLRQLGAIRARVDHEQQVAFVHLAAFGEIHALDVARDARPHFDGLDGFEPAGEFVPLGDVALERGGHGNLGRRRLRCGCRFAAAAVQRNQRSEQRTGCGKRGHECTRSGHGHYSNSVSPKTRQRRSIRHSDLLPGLLTAVCQEPTPRDGSRRGAHCRDRNACDQSGWPHDIHEANQESRAL